MKFSQTPIMFATLFGASMLPALAAAAVKPPKDDQISYQLKTGESIYSIGRRYFVNEAAYEAVRRYNNIKNPTQLAPGANIAIPVRYLKGKPLEAQIVAFRGDVQIGNGSVAGIPAIGTKIEVGSILQTAGNGFVTIALSNGSRITIPSGSRIRVVQMRQLLLTGSTDFDFALEKGRAEATVTKAKSNNDRFRLRTPTAVSAVRGTHFRIAYDDANSPSLTEVTEGGVAVGIAKTPRAPSSSVPAGFGAAASLSGSIATEPLLAAPAVVRPGRLQKDALVTIGLAPVETARGYHVQLAKDAGFTDMVAESRSETPQSQFADIPDGNYFVRAMAIAPSGLEGLSESYAIRRQFTVVGGSAASSAPGTFAFKWLGQGAGVRSYRFQLLRQKTDAVPLIDEAGLNESAITLTGLVPGVYYWRVGVRQFGTDGVGESWTPAEKFTVSAPEK